jgi:aryl-alcohol dehydrogenase-like predicted oxidoreductase
MQKGKLGNGDLEVSAAGLGYMGMRNCHEEGEVHL